jgi:hypothetical protein
LNRAFGFLIILVGLASSVLTILVTFQFWYPQAHPDGRVAIIALSSFIAIGGAGVVWQEFRYARKARYAEAFPYLKQIFYETSIHNPGTMGSPGDIEGICRMIVNRLASAFSLITGTKCSVCIKVLVDSGEAVGARPTRKL